MSLRTRKHTRNVLLVLNVAIAVGFATVFMHKRRRHLDLCRMGAIVSKLPVGPVQGVSTRQRTRISFGCIAPGTDNNWVVITSITDGRNFTYTNVPKSLVLKIYFFK